jgi:hypothetical protein
MKDYAAFGPPVLALATTVVIVAVGLTMVVWYWFLALNGSVEVLG